MTELDETLRRAALPTADMTDPSVDESARNLAAAICRSPAGASFRGSAAVVVRRRRRLRRRTVGVALAVATAIGAPVGAATIIAAHTGLFGHGGEEGTGEFIRLDSPQFPQVLDQIRRQEDLPLPPGDSWDGLLHQFAGISGPSVETTSGVAMNVEEYARCRWQGAFIDATRSGQASLQQRAAAVIGEIPSWPQMSKQSDPTFSESLHDEAAAASQGDAGHYDPNDNGPLGNIAQDYTVNCTDMQVGQ